jgi:hypothetical protein
MLSSDQLEELKRELISKREECLVKAARLRQDVAQYEAKADAFNSSIDSVERRINARPRQS